MADRVVAATQELTGHDFAVRRKLGDEPNGDALLAVEGKPRRQLLYLLTADHWAESRRGDIEILGLEPCLAHFGARTES